MPGGLGGQSDDGRHRQDPHGPVDRRASAGRRSSPAVLLRGYGSRDPDQSDEARLYEVLDGVPILANRIASPHCIGTSSTNRPPTAPVLDDGFQHRRLHRDLDLVWSMRRLTRSACCRGTSPRAAQSLRRADAVVITRSAGWTPNSRRIESLHGRPHWPGRTMAGRTRTACGRFAAGGGLLVARRPAVRMPARDRTSRPGPRLPGRRRRSSRTFPFGITRSSPGPNSIASWRLEDRWTGSS